MVNIKLYTLCEMWNWHTFHQQTKLYLHPTPYFGTLTCIFNHYLCCLSLPCFFKTLCCSQRSAGSVTWSWQLNSSFTLVIICWVTQHSMIIYIVVLVSIPPIQMWHSRILVQLLTGYECFHEHFKVHFCRLRMEIQTTNHRRKKIKTSGKWV